MYNKASEGDTTMTDFQTKSNRIRQLRAEGKIGVSYNIHINEAQRVALLEILKLHPDAILDDLTLINDSPPLAGWDDMLSSIVDEEAESPGIVHGFCL